MRFSSVGCAHGNRAGSRAFSCRACCPMARAMRSQLVRLKDKLGNRSNASAEVEFDGSARLADRRRRAKASARIVEMVNHTRLDCAIGSAGAACAPRSSQAIHHAAYRRAFGALLIDQPLMRNVLADLALESEAATAALPARRARNRRFADATRAAAALKRIGTALAKYYVCKRTPAVVAEALECLGGNGYVEESVMPRLYREAPLNSIWEGSGNVNALDVLRVLRKQPEVARGAGATRSPRRGEPRVARERSACDAICATPAATSRRRARSRERHGAAVASGAARRVTRRPPSPTRSSRAGSRATGAARSARCRAAARCATSSIAPRRARRR